jgi:hypothetical protein
MWYWEKTAQWALGDGQGSNTDPRAPTRTRPGWPIRPVAERSIRPAYIDRTQFWMNSIKGLADSCIKRQSYRNAIGFVTHVFSDSSMLEKPFRVLKV